MVCNASAGEDGDESSSLEDEFVIPVEVLKPDESATSYVAFRRPESSSELFNTATFTNILKFTLKEIDPSTNEPEEVGDNNEYQIDDLELTGGDYVLPAFAGSFDNIWSSIPENEENAAEETLQLSAAKSIQEAVELLVKQLGMQPLEGTEVALSTSTHALKLFGRSIQGGKVAGSVRMAYSAKSGVTVKIEVRSEEEGLAALVLGAVV